MYLDRAVYNFYKGEEIVDTTTYEKMNPQNISMTKYVEIVGDDTYYLPITIEDNTVNGIKVTSLYDSVVIDCSMGINHRSGTYLHKGSTGNYVIRVAADSEIEESYMDYEYYLQEDAVYKVEYDVDELESNYVVVRNFSFSEINY